MMAVEAAVTAAGLPGFKSSWSTIVYAKIALHFYMLYYLKSQPGS